jgi:very-short-patch-repair endonuclease
VPARRTRARLTGPATRASALAAGLSYGDLRHPGVVRLSRDTFLPRALLGDVAARFAAVLLAAPPGSVISHASAAALWDLAVPLAGPDPRVHLTVRPGSAVRNRSDRCIHRTPYVADDMTRRHGFPVTTPARTWRDLAAVLPPAPLLAVTDQVLRRWCAADELRRQLARRPHGRGSARARSVLPVADPLAESPMESVLRWLIVDDGLPSPVLQHPILDQLGRFIGRADLAWPDRKVLVEFDGDLHRDRAVFVNDLRRQNRLIAAGWTVLRFTSADVLGRPAEVIAEIRTALRQRVLR